MRKEERVWEIDSRRGHGDSENNRGEIGRGGRLNRD